MGASPGWPDGDLGAGLACPSADRRSSWRDVAGVSTGVSGPAPAAVVEAGTGRPAANVPTQATAPAAIAQAPTDMPTADAQPNHPPGYRRTTSVIPIELPTPTATDVTQTAALPLPTPTATPSAAPYSGELAADPDAPPTDLPTPAEPAPQPTPDGMDRTVRVPILMYHYLSEPPPGADAYRVDLSVSPDLFAQHLDRLQAAGYTTVNLYDLADFLARGTPLPPQPVIITFDDGYRDNFENAVPPAASRAA